MSTFTIFYSQVCWKREFEQESASQCPNHRSCYMSSSLSHCTYCNLRRCPTTLCTYTALSEFRYRLRTLCRQPSASALRHPRLISPSTRRPRPTRPAPPAPPLPATSCYSCNPNQKPRTASSPPILVPLRNSTSTRRSQSPVRPKQAPYAFAATLLKKTRFST
jgi:hypothetical protein